ncbi:PepSY domain-containing protein [Hoeflea poritis]|uniref:PepSY domain-containing protein n=1 Tax=Hoeflea poritis TaxID=2993659 RepID=A0ABT4VJ57_9HYPH|nr:PepSY domain-containing protein [Hoeflea poritis]MDA4844757.1 PepSY domain-containing protein [Hoeflea poritis]
MKKSAFAALAALVTLAVEPSFATGLHTCESGDQAGWKTMGELEEKMTAEGWQVRRIKEDGGCYEAYGTSPEGERVEAYFDPVTLEMLLVARRGEILYQKQE